MAINYYSVLNDLEEKGWSLLSTEYKNLKTPLKMKCPEGHIVEDTFEHWRKRCSCEQCIAGDPYKVKQNKIPKKNSGTYRILALDAATHVTGYSVYDNGTLVGYGTYKTVSEDTTSRINEVKKWLVQAITEWLPDFIGVEHIQLQNFGVNKNQQQVETYRILANLQGVLLDTIFEIDLPCELVYSSTWRKTCDINEGNSTRENKKKAAQDKVFSWYGLQCTQDEADAICIGKYFVLEKGKKKTTWGEEI